MGEQEAFRSCGSGCTCPPGLLYYRLAVLVLRVPFLRVLELCGGSDSKED